MVDEERREYLRFPAILHIRYGKEVEVFSRSDLLNASLGGLFIKTEYPLERGERILTSILIPDADDPILVECEVVWNRRKEDAKGPSGMGLKFLNLSAEDKDKITRVLVK
ncbi:MAG: PilZ domain-containing protein [Pseudomonadota bacterium]